MGSPEPPFRSSLLSEMGFKLNCKSFELAFVCSELTAKSFYLTQVSSLLIAGSFLLASGNSRLTTESLYLAPASSELSAESILLASASSELPTRLLGPPTLPVPNSQTGRFPPFSNHDLKTNDKGIARSNEWQGVKQAAHRNHHGR